MFNGRVSSSTLFSRQSLKGKLSSLDIFGNYRRLVMNKSLTNIVNRFCLGEHLSDQELVDLRKHYEDLKVATQPFGERYVLVHIEAARNLHRIEGYLYARKLAATAGRAEQPA